MGNLQKRRLTYLAVTLWTVTFVVIAFIVFENPHKRSVIPVYFNAVANWIAKDNLYGTEYSFHYLPQFVYVYMPFYLMGTPWGDILWRGLSLFILVWGLFLFIKEYFPSNQDMFLLMASLLVLAPTIGALRNGQANLLFSGLCLWTILFLMRSDWWLCSLCIGLLIALKQIGIIPALLAAAAFPALWWRLAIVILLLLAMPFILTDSGYAVSQYREAIKEMSNLAATQKRFADINGLFRAIGFTLEGTYSLAVRALAGLITLILWLLTKRHIQQPLAGIIFLALCTSYMMLFHPMTEQNSYVILAPAIALTAVYMRDKNISLTISIVIMSLCVGLGILPEIVRRWAPDMGLWFKPLSALIYLAVIVRIIYGKTTQRA